MIRVYEHRDHDAVLALNAANVPEVGPMDAEKLAFFLEISPFLQVVEADEGIIGMLVGLTEESVGYGSPNYAWFLERLETFAYVDRIAIAESARGMGWGPELYRRFEAWALETGKAALCAEVNTIPSNPRSIRFHELFGFAEVARRNPYGPDEEVAMFEKLL
ncbi:MAG: GNAT family N-acetyltransferase [Acidimicrobiales bacterium]